MKPLTCFLIDDDEDDQIIFRLAIKDMDDTIECIMANNALTALELLTQSPPFRPDFIFLDLNMRRVNGRQCSKLFQSVTTNQTLNITEYNEQ